MENPHFLDSIKRISEFVNSVILFNGPIGVSRV